MNKKDWIIIIETVAIMILSIHAIIYTVISQDLVEQVRECDTVDLKRSE